MKNIKYCIFLLSVMMIGVSSCSDFLDVKPEKNATAETYFSTDKETTDAINGLYWVMNLEGTFGRDIFWEQAGGGDDFIYGRSRGSDHNNLANFTFSGRESPLTYGWNTFSNYTARSNWVIYNLSPRTDLSNVQKIRLGEAYFMRAFCHYYLAYRHGRIDQGVPFDRYEDYDPYPAEYKVPEQRATVMVNYDLIIQDLQKAADLLPFFEDYATSDYGRAHKVTAWGYMVRVYAYWAQHDASKWALIPPLVDRIENEGKRGLLDSYADVFTIANNWSKEYIWSSNSSGYNYAGSIFPGVVLENKAWGRYNGWGYFKPTLGLYNEFAANDERRGVTILEYNDEFVLFGEPRRFYSTADMEAGFQLAKYMDPYKYGIVNDKGTGESSTVSPNGDRPTTDLNLPLMRFAEMLLFKAEALIMQNNGTEAAAVLNRIAKRAGLGENVYTNATMADLKHERRCELAGEFTDRFMDLKRWQDWSVLNEAKMGRKYADRSDPTSTWTPVETWPARTFNPQTDIAFPYNPDEVIKADGLLKQNPMD